MKVRKKTLQKFRDKTVREYLRLHTYFNFAGTEYFPIKHDPDGVGAVEAIYMHETHGRIIPTKSPKTVETFFRSKASVNLHIDMYAQDRGKCYLPKIIFDKMVERMNLPNWFVEAVEKRKYKYMFDKDWYGGI